MTGWTIRRWRLPARVERALDARAQHYRITYSAGWRIIWLGYDRPDNDEPVWLPVALEKVTVHGKDT